ncbi:hypothetical protein LINPERPRIM_LOCUS23541 [Linum perenne]
MGHWWQVGDGAQINPFVDQWIPTLPPSAPILNMRDSILDIPISVASFINNVKWDHSKLKSIFRDDSINKILSIPIPRRHVRDKIIWQFAASGEYSVHSGYEVAKEVLAGPPQFEPTDVVD